VARKILDGAYTLALKDILGLLGAYSGLKRTLNAIARRAAKALATDGATVFFLEPHKEFLVPVGYYGLTDPYLHKGTLRADRSIPQILQGKTVSVYDVTSDERIEYPDAARQERIASLLGVPVWSKGSVVGEMRLYSRMKRRFSAVDKDFVTAVAGAVTLVLEKAETASEASKEDATRKTAVLTAEPESFRPAVAFAHPSEAEFARLLDFYRIEWLYEPRSFAIKWNGETPAEMFTPDFYLPEMDLYVELTTMKQRLITDKNRKVRRVKELFPEVKIRLLNKSDYVRLLAKYGYGPLAEAKVQGVSRVLFSHNQIQRRVAALARQVSKDYAGKELVLVGVLKGVVCFMSDFMQHVSIPVKLDFMAVSSFAGDGKPVTITKDLDSVIAGKHVLMVEDIADTGMTLNYVLEHLRQRQPASLAVCALMNRPARRLVDVPLEYIGFEVPDEFVVGYGLDYQGQYRNLPFIGVLAPEGTTKSPK